MATALSPSSPPTAAAALAAAARVSALAVLAIVAWWVSARLGGVAAGPDPNTGSTARLFNWHPVLMTLAFPVLMSEALLAYRAPWSGADTPRPRRKLAHGALHSLAAVCAGGGLAAAWRSHTLADPPAPNLYSPHSFLGLAALAALALQFATGAGAYVWPGAAPDSRRALGPVHKSFGRATYCAGLAAAAAGLQEKATFLQVLGKKAPFSAEVRAPAWAALLLLPLGAAVLCLHAREPSDGGGAAGGANVRPPPGQHDPLPTADDDFAAQ